jgi:hypothetical protein
MWWLRDDWITHLFLRIKIDNYQCMNKMYMYFTVSVNVIDAAC